MMRRGTNSGEPKLLVGSGALQLMAVVAVRRHAAPPPPAPP